MRVVEEIAFDAPGLVVNLLPHGAGLDVDFPAVKFERTETGLGRGSGAGAATAIVRRRGCPRLALAVENLFAIEGDSKVVDFFQQLVDLALAQVEFLDRLIYIRLVFFSDDLRTFGEEQNARICREAC